MSTRRKKSKKRWIVINGKKEDFPETLPDYLLQAEQRIVKHRPYICGQKQQRLAKDYVYLVIRDQMLQHQISGSYIGLAAAYTAEIFEVFKPLVVGSFYNCQIKRQDYKKLLKYQPIVSRRYPGVDFQVKYGDIIRHMKESTREFAILDLDFMCMLDTQKVKQITDAIKIAATDKAVAAIWHCANRRKKEGNRRTERVYRPSLTMKLGKHFDILDYKRINYWEGYPMMCDIFALQRKLKKRDKILQSGA